MKKFLSLLLTAFFILSSFGASTVFAESEPLVPRSFRLDMISSVVSYDADGADNGEAAKDYIALDIVVKDITDAYGLVSFECDVLFDGDALVPLWQTDRELNNDGKTGSVPPQMITAWPTYEKTYYIPGYGPYTETVFAAEGLCKPYSVTGKGKLNVNMLVDVDHVKEGCTEDGEMAVRLYFIPVNGFKTGDSYTFTIDGAYDVSAENVADIGVAGTSAILFEGDGYDKSLLRVYGYGDESTCIVGLGDANVDGKANSLDAAMVLRYDAGLMGEDGLLMTTADVNSDGKVNSLDAAFILRYDAGLIKDLYTVMARK